MVTGLCASANWEDKRDASRRGIVIDKQTKAVYGHVTKDSDSQLRKKFAALLFGTIPYGMIRIPLRAASICTGDFYLAGCRIAKVKWRRARQKWSLGQKASPPPDEANLKKRILFYSLQQLAINIAKLVTFPLALLALTFASLYGLCNPLSGRKLFGRIEEIWCREIIPASLKAKRTEAGFVVDYSAPCMQPKKIWERRNLYLTFHDYTRTNPKSLIVQLKNLLINEKKFFQTEVNYKEIKRLLNGKAFQIKEMSQREKKALRYNLQSLHRRLLGIRKTRERIIKHEIANREGKEHKLGRIMKKMEGIKEAIHRKHLEGGRDEGTQGTKRT